MPHPPFSIQTLSPVVPARLALFAFCILNLAFAAACAKAQAADLVPDGPPLAMTAPPPRVITLTDDSTVAPPSPPNTETPPAPAPATTTTRPRVTQPRATETPAATAAAPPATPPPAAPPAAPPLEVRAVPSAAAAGEEKKVRDVMLRAANALNRITWQKLSAEEKTRYDQSKRFSEQAEQALKEKNFVYAMALAE